jgi:hypothetical protein
MKVGPGKMEKNLLRDTPQRYEKGVYFHLKYGLIVSYNDDMNYIEPKNGFDNITHNMGNNY